MSNAVKLRIVQTVGGFAFFALMLSIIFALTNFINYAIWLPSIPALLGLMIMAGALLRKLENK